MAAALTDVPYAGMVDGRPVEHDAPHLLVSGRTGASKTRSILSIQAATWGRRPVVCVSSKGDLAAMTAKRRGRYGPCYLMDLAGEVTDDEVQRLGLTRVASDPCALITDDDSAVDLAGLLLEIGSLGAGDGKSGGGDSFWMSLAEGPLAAILQSASWYEHPETGEMTWGGGIEWARQAAQNVGEIGDTDTDAPADYDTPSWDTAVLRCATIDSLHGDSLVSAKTLDPKQRDSIGINMRVATKAWSLRRVAGRGDLPPFTPDMLLTPDGPATLYVTSPLTGAAAPAATATLTAIVNHWRAAAGRIATLLMVIDECPSTAPLPRLGAWLADLRSYQCRIVAACQASSQFAPRWGDAGLRILRDTFPGILILPGAPETEILEQAAWSTLPEERTTSSTDAGGRASHARDRTSGLEGSELLPRSRGTALLIVGGMPKKVVRLVDISHTDVAP